MGDCTVYMHVFPNGKKYVGITGQDVSRRRRDGEGCYGQAVYNAILKFSESHKGMRYGNETPRKKSAIFSGAGNPMYGTRLSQKRKEKLQAACVKAKSKPVVCIETGKVYQSAAQAQRKTGICPRIIGYVANHDKRYKTAGGYHWEYKEVA